MKTKSFSTTTLSGPDIRVDSTWSLNQVGQSPMQVNAVQGLYVVFMLLRAAQAFELCDAQGNTLAESDGKTFDCIPELQIACAAVTVAIQREIKAATDGLIRRIQEDEAAAGGLTEAPGPARRSDPT